MERQNISFPEKLQNGNLNVATFNEINFVFYGAAAVAATKPTNQQHLNDTTNNNNRRQQQQQHV